VKDLSITKQSTLQPDPRLKTLQQTDVKQIVDLSSLPGEIPIDKIVQPKTPLNSKKFVKEIETSRYQTRNEPMASFKHYAPRAQSRFERPNFNKTQPNQTLRFNLTRGSEITPLFTMQDFYNRSTAVPWGGRTFNTMATTAD
jgi:hypothetical protein